MTQANQDRQEWLKILGGTLLFTAGFFFLFEAFASIDRWDLYQNEKRDDREYMTWHNKKFITVPRSGKLPFLDNVPVLVLLGTPLLIIGSVFVAKGVQEYLKPR